MITYEYRCDSCGLQFEIRRAITNEPVDECPKCHGKLTLMISGGSGFMIKGSGREGQRSNRGDCSFESSGRTCCGQKERCAQPPCETKL